MAIAIPRSATALPDVHGPVQDAIESAQASIARALINYGATEKPSFHPSCSFSAVNLSLALEEMQKHLGVGNLLERRVSPCGVARPVPATVLKASWVYCNTPQEVAMLSYLIREVEVEHLYIGGAPRAEGALFFAPDVAPRSSLLPEFSIFADGRTMCGWRSTGPWPQSHCGSASAVTSADLGRAPSGRLCAALWRGDSTLSADPRHRAASRPPRAPCTTPMRPRDYARPCARTRSGPSVNR